MRVVVIALLLSLLGCSSPTQPYESDDAVSNLRAQAAAVERAIIQEDHTLMADLMHPSLVRGMGGREACLRKLAKEAADLRRQGLKFHDFRFGEPSHMFEVKGELYAIYPYTLEITGPGGEPASQPNYLICHSTDAGATWRFMDGAGIGTDRERLKRFLPSFPTELSLPKPRRLVVYE